ncbi:solute carrier family 25 member 35-like [Microplitis demolitor]|uniref:solute carrier family 25 member 35-like n=1 Tax=Microplitis demolitor TaxID=69319 RepID=UPI0004CD5D57|nr:solute carrier family 25 member 35-like [Microplitis demolitor]
MSENTLKNKPVGAEFGIGGLAAMGAGIFTNPIDVIKVRLQMQGELLRRGTYKVLYKNTFHAAYVIAKHEGITALQSGVRSALVFQFVLNGTKLGVFKSARSHGITVNEDGQTNIPKTIFITGAAGCFGSVLASPFYMIKTQMQSQSAEKSIATGFQHGHTSEWAAFKNLWRTSGIGGLYRQCFANTPRIFCSAAIQLTTLSIVDDWLKPIKIFNENSVLLTFCSALVGGTCVALFMQPFDAVSIRIYNQGTDSSGKGLLYRNYFDAYYKIFKIEGLLGLYKGVFPTWLRIGPHTVLCFCFYEQLESIYNKVV